VNYEKKHNHKIPHIEIVKKNINKNIFSIRLPCYLQSLKSIHKRCMFFEWFGWKFQQKCLVEIDGNRSFHRTSTFPKPLAKRLFRDLIQNDSSNCIPSLQAWCLVKSCLLSLLAPQNIAHFAAENQKEATLCQDTTTHHNKGWDSHGKDAEIND
jgi:hypothetical protein